VKVDCACPRANHRHGTLGAYNRDRCRCFPCRVAHSRATTAYRNGGSWLEADRRSAVGARRRLQALAVIGWSAPALAAQSTLSASHLSNLRRANGQASVSPHIADEVTRLYEALWDKPRDDHDARRCYTQARRYGWQPPMGLDDDGLDAFEAPRRRRADSECGSHAAFNRHAATAHPAPRSTPPARKANASTSATGHAADAAKPPPSERQPHDLRAVPPHRRVARKPRRRPARRPLPLHAPHRPTGPPSQPTHTPAT
jgi:hypothetical protein